MAILQVRDIDDRLYNALKFLAKQEKRSISQEVIYILEDFFNSASRPIQNQTEAFLSLSGSWEGEETADELIENIKSSRKDSQRFEADNGIFN